MRTTPLAASLIACCLLVPAAAAVSPGVDCTSAGLGAQLPDPVRYFYSDTDPTPPYVSFESFRPVAVSSTVTSVCWWGVYDDCDPNVPPDDFTITYHDDDGGLPGPIRAGPFSVNAQRATTGRTVNALPELVYRAEHPPVLLSDECTWISIVNDLDDCRWAWVVATSGDAGHVQNGTELFDWDLAFSLDIDIEPAGCAIEAGFEPYCSGAAPAGCNCGNHGAPGNGCANAIFPGGANLAGVTHGGPPSVANDEVELVASRMTPLSICLFLQASDHVTNGVGLPFGDGLLCLRGSVRRLAVKGTGLGTARYPGPFDAPLSVRGAIRATGGRAYYQVLYRDANPFGPCGDESRGLNWTNGLRIDWE
jgi:hypothetical protein